MRHALNAVRRAARRKNDAHRDWRAAIVTARAEGATHAQLADAAGVTRQRVGAILARWAPTDREENEQ